jgi:hypothetical protein
MMLEDTKGLVAGIEKAFRAAGAGPVSTRLTVPCMRPHGRGRDRFDQISGCTREHASNGMLAHDGAGLRADGNGHAAVSQPRRGMTLRNG